MKAKVILVDEEPKETEVWMQKEDGTIFIVHPLFLHSDDQFYQIGIAIDANTGKDIPLLRGSMYDKLNDKCELIGKFEPEDKDEFILDYGASYESA